MVREGSQILEGLTEHAPPNYGRSYSILPRHDGPCDVGQGPLFKAAGALVLSGSDLFLHAPSEAPEGASYLDLATFKLHNEPGGNRAAFGQWTLWYDALGQPQPSVSLLAFSAK
jgi:hypothetical protein